MANAEELKEVGKCFLLDFDVGINVKMTGRNLGSQCHENSELGLQLQQM